MDVYLDWMAAAGVEVYIILGVFILSLSVGVFTGIKRARGRTKETSLPVVPTETQEAVEGAKPEKSESLLGTGAFKCMCFKASNILDFTTIPKPIGEIYQFEPSCPISGAGFIVKEEADGKVVDYDPREVEVHLKQTPEFAWFATHWDIVTKNFWTVPVQWWKSPANWFAAAMIIVTFICALVVFD